MISVMFEKVNVWALKVGGMCTALFIVAIYFSTSLAIILSGLLALLWLLSGQFMVLPVTLKRNPVAAFSLLLLLCFIVGLGYGVATNGEAISMLSKYRELLFIPLLTSFLSTERTRWVAIFLGSSAERARRKTASQKHLSNAMSAPHKVSAFNLPP